MKISSILLAAVQSAAAEECGGYQPNFAEETILSPRFGVPVEEWYEQHISCLWTLENECAESYTITPHFFDLHVAGSFCESDSLTFTSSGDEPRTVLCGGDYDAPRAFEPNEYDYVTIVNNTHYIEISDANNTEPFTMQGSELQMHLIGLFYDGFNISITANLNPNCESGKRPAETCMSDLGETDYPEIAYWSTNFNFDKPAPLSDFSENIDTESIRQSTGDQLILECLETCIETAGCFKVKANESSDDRCMLRGNKLTPEVGKTFAVNGDGCREDGRRAWIDGSSETRLYYFISGPESEDAFLEALISKNYWMTQWQMKEEKIENMADDILTSTIWEFSIAERPAVYYKYDKNGAWYLFHSITHFRQFLPEGASERTQRNSDDALLDSIEIIAKQVVEEFEADLEESISETGAVVEETEPAEITAEVAEEVPEPQDYEFKTAFDAVEKIIEDAFAGKKKTARKFKQIRKQFGWFTDYSDAPCEENAGNGIDAGIEYDPPVIDAEDPCRSIKTFYTALVGYYDDFVCMDRALELGKGKIRKASNKLGAAKKRFNGFLKKLKCEERV